MEIKKIRLPFRIKKTVLALGAQSKNTLCLAKGNFAYLSAMHPDLSNPKDFLDFEQAVKYFLQKSPRIIAYDMHPEYQSTKYAHCLNAKRYTQCAVQHHHAHIASCMADNAMADQRVIGVAFDGTGLGDDNSLWGAEFLVCDYRNFKRRGRLKEIPLLGAEKAITQPWRLAIAWLYSIYREKLWRVNINFLKKIDKDNWAVLKKMYSSGINSPLASSMGRLFDAAASIILGRVDSVGEAELAMELEKAAGRFQKHNPGYDFKVVKQQGCYVIDPAAVFKGIISDLRQGRSQEEMAHRFHITVGLMIRRVCLLIRRDSKLNKVVFSGGAFQNKILLALSRQLLQEQGFKVFTHLKLSPNDSAISFGEAIIGGLKN